MLSALVAVLVAAVSFVTAQYWLALGARRSGAATLTPPLPGPPAAAAPAARPARRGTLRAFSALRHRDFRLLVTGVFLSLIGLWVFMTTQAWLALELTGSNAWVSVVTSAESLPFLFVSLFAGVLADRVNRKRLMFFTRTAIVVLMLTEAMLAASGMLTPYHLAGFAFAAGIIFSLDLPTRQSLVADLVPPEDVANAVALHFSSFNLTMVLGPALGAGLLATAGAAWSFTVTALGNAALAVLVLMMHVPPPRHHAGASALKQLREGVGYVAHTPVVRWILTLSLFVTTFGFAYQVLMPGFAHDVLGTSEGGYGTLASAAGLGALAGSLGVAALGNVRRKAPLVFAGPIVFSAALVGLAVSPVLLVAAGAVFVAGAASAVYMTMNNTVVLTTIPEHLRGRVMSVAILIWGLTPAGSLAAGVLADQFGIRVAIGSSAAVGLAATLIIFSTRRVMRAL